MYSIKTDLDITGGATVAKDLLVKGDAVFNKNLTVNGTVTFADAVFTAIEAETVDISSTLDVAGKASLNGGIEVHGNSVIGNLPVGSDTATINSNAQFQSPVSMAGNLTQTAGTAVLKDTQVASMDVLGTSSFKGNITAETGTTAAFDKITATDATFTNTATTDITSTGTANFKDVNISGTLGGTFSLSDVNATTLTVSGLTSLQGGVTLGSNITGVNSSANFRDIKIGSNAANTNYRLSFNYSAPSLRPTVILQNEIQSELMSPATLSVLKTASFGDSSLSTFGITGNGLNKLDYLTVSGNSVQDPTTPLLQVTSGKTKVHDFEVTGTATIPNIESTGTANFNNINVSGTLGGTFSLDDIEANTLTVSGLTSLVGGVTLGADISGANSTANFKAVSLGQNAADANVKYGFAYSAPGARPTVILQNEIQSELVSPAVLNVQKTATFGDASLATYGITGNGLNKLDYLSITGNGTQSPATPQLQVAGKSVLNDVEFTGTVTGLTVDVSGQDLTPKSVDAAEAIKGQTLESVGQTTVGTNLQVGGTANVVGALTGTAATFTGDVSAAKGTFSGDVSVTGQTVTVRDLVVTGTTTGVTAQADVDGLDIAPNKVDVTTTLSVAGDTTLAGLTASSVTSTGDVTGASVSGNTVTAAGALSGGSLAVTGAGSMASLTVPSITGDTTFANNVTITGTLTPSSIDLSTTDVSAASLTTTGNVTVGGSLAVTGAIDLSAADVVTKSVSATNPSTFGVINASSVAATGDVSGGTLTTTGAAKVGTLTSTGVVSGSRLSSGTATITTSVTVPTLQAEAAGAGTLNLASNVVAAKDLTVTGVFKPEGGLDLTTVDITANSLTTTADVNVGGNLVVDGTFDLSAADVSVKSLASAETITSAGVITVTDSTNTSSLPKITSTDATLFTVNAGTINATGNSVLQSVSATQVTANSAEFSGGGLGLQVDNDANVGGALSVGGIATVGSLTTTAASLNIAKNTAITGDLAVSGTLTAGSIDLSNTDVTVKSLDSLGNAHIAGNLTVDGAFDLSATNLVAASLASCWY
ncbi:tail fiber protein [Escherichia phage vB_Ec-M-J]|nr:tail fiber protein [Escherichia phage vB_Ec-M-J]